MPVEKLNQDAHFECVKLGGTEIHFFGVCDGHGVFGHLVSDFLKRRLPLILNKEPLLRSHPKEALGKAFQRMSEELQTQSGVDLSFSGSTCVSLFIKGSTIYTANVGDSRAVVGRKSASSGMWTALALSTDHKPELPTEKQRILARRGRVEPYRLPNGEFVGPYRVWLKEQDVPGLGMSRSFGDLVAASVGVIAEPEVTIHQLSKEDKVIVIGSDGLFEFFPNDEIIRFIIPYLARGDPKTAAAELVKEAQNRWRRTEQVIDDTTAIVILLNVS